MNVLKSLTNYAIAIMLIGSLFLCSCGDSRINLNEAVQVEKGKIDLSNVDFASTKPINLNGNWEFYWEKKMISQDFYDSSHYNIMKYYPVPSEWSETEENPTLDQYGYATYRVEIDLGKSNQNIAIMLKSRGMAYKVIVDGKILAESGTVGKDEATTIPESRNDVIPIKFAKENMELIIQTSNFHNRSGGLIGEITIGEADLMLNRHKRNIWIDLFLAGAILMMGIYHLGLFIARKNNFSPLYFALFCIFIFIRILVSENISSEIFSLNWVLIHKVDYLTYYLAFGSFFLYSAWVFRMDSSKIITQIAVGFSLIFALGVIILPPRIYTELLVIYHIYNLIAAIYLTYLVILAVLRKRSGATIYLVGWLLFFATGINDLLYFSGIIEAVTLIPIGLFLFILCQAFLLVLRYEESFKTNSKLKNELNHVNKNLENIVEERTNSLRAANEDLAITNDKMTDSISYAKRIQLAILPKEKEIKNFIPDSFIILRPRDIVSGDFHWFSYIENTPRGPVSVIVIADCTGHGVPGAFMSMSGNAFLNQVVNLQQIYDPGKIAAAINDMIRDTLHQNEKENTNRDGMDAAICCIIHDEKQIEFAGAQRPLLYVRNDELLKIAGAKASLGGNQREVDNNIFKTSVVSYAEDEVSVYLYTDGYTDQFGGYDNKKFGSSQLSTLILENVSKPAEFQQSIFGFAINDWIKNGEEEQTDDILIMGFKLKD